MKKRDYYILAILACLVIYAALNRRSIGTCGAEKLNGLVKQNASTKVLMTKDSLASAPFKVNKAEI